MEAVKQGSAAVGLRSQDLVVIASLKRSTSELASYQKKVFKVDDHLGIAVSGLIADGRVLRKYMIQECLNHRYVYNTPLQVGRLVTELSDKSQVFTQKSEKRPYGVGLLVAGYDRTGAHLFNTDPSGNFSEYKAQSIGARSQSAKTYLEKHFETFDSLSRDELIMHALEALKTTQQGARLTSRNVVVGFVGKDVPFTLLEDDDVKSYVDRLPDNEGPEAPPAEKDDDDEKKEEEDGKEAAAVPPPTSGSAAMEDEDTA